MGPFDEDDPVENMLATLQRMASAGAADDEIQFRFLALMLNLSYQDQTRALEEIAQGSGRKIGELTAAPRQGVDVDPLVDPDDPDLMMVCAVCDEPLQRFTASAEQQAWIHIRSYLPKAHDAVPIVVDRQSRATGQCDFCGVHEKLHWRFTGTNLRQRTEFQQPTLTDGGTFARSESRDFGVNWTACEACSVFLRERDIEGLHQLRLRRRTYRHPDPEVHRKAEAHVLAMWAAFIPTIHTATYIGPKPEPATLNPRMMPKLQMGLLRFWQNDGLRERFNRNRARNRGVHRVPGVHLGLEDEFSIPLRGDEPFPVDAWHNHVKHLCAGIEAAELWWASRDFTQLAIMAGKDFTKLIISREELPAPVGFMMFEDPIGELPRGAFTAAIRGLTWTLVPGGVWINLYIQGEDGDPAIDVEQMRTEYGYLSCPNAGIGIPFDHEVPIPEQDKVEFATTIFAAWFLMRQPGVAETETAPVDKKFDRAYRRANQGRRPPDVRLLDLRKQKHRSSAGHDGQPGRKLTVRVFRSGHWKRQAYGVKRGLRKTIYISPYIAGPEGAPLKERPPVVKVL